jgi:hypothetical protein
MELKKYTTLQPVLQGGKIVPAKQVIELNPSLDSTKKLIATKHIEPAKAEKPEKPEKPAPGDKGDKGEGSKTGDQK